ncbi:PREDICTED: uncharacterized protein LOC101310969 [Fragaria vesca subsp. vesca]|uniref:uncharacterized protein LOC101310969 n=1 Tax=Fragaria vesca subsp. vesca TaxID=101020 RepID=UPI0002C2ED1F|nr:PREDICTED: uncharacterized protein LOC101310969 [Fragaria vesca subsp. vesca]
MMTNLRELILRDLWKLQEIWHGPAPHSVFRNLNILAFRYCHKLKGLLPHHVVQCLLQLEHLWVEECCSLNRVIEASEQIESQMIIIPRLKNIVLRRLPQLSGFYRSAAIVDHVECPSLEHFYVDKCPQFSTPATSDFHSRNQVQVNDEEQFISLMRRKMDTYGF